MNKAENQSGDVLNQYADRIYDTVGQRLKTFTDTPSLVMYWAMGMSVLLILLVPVLAVGVGWMIDMFTAPDLVVIDMAFEAIVVGLIFLFGVGLLFFLKTKAPSLAYLIVFVSFILTIMASSMFGVVANKCLSDMKCDSSKYFAAMGIAFVLSLASYVFLRAVQHLTPLFGITYLAVTIWESLIWLWQAGRQVGIDPTGDAFRGVFLLLSSILWLVIFGASAQKKAEKVVKPNRWGTY